MCTTQAPLTTGATSGEPWLFGNLTDLQTPMSVRVLLEEHGVETYTDCLDWTARNLTTQLGSLREIDQLVETRASAAVRALSVVTDAIIAGTLRLTDLSVLVSLRAAEQRNRVLVAAWNSKCSLTGESLAGRLIDDLGAGKLPNASEIDLVIETIKQCYLIGSEIIANLDFVEQTGCPLLSTSPLQHDHQIRLFCAPSGGELSLQSVLQLQTSSAIFTIDSQSTFLKLKGLSEQLINNYNFEDSSTFQNRTAGEQARFLICLSAYHGSLVANFSEDSPSVSSSSKLCSTICNDVKLLRDALVNFVNFSSLLTISVLNHALTDFCVNKNQRPGDTCFDIDVSGKVVSRLSASVLPPKFCLDFTCKFPLTATSDSSHWYPSHQESVREVRDGIALFFPSAALPFNGSRFPCAVACSTVYFTADEERVMRTTRFACGCIGVVFTLVAISAYLLNREKLQKLPRRLNFYLNMAFLLGPGLESLLAVGTDSMKIVYCHSDNTLRYDEPRGGVTLCLVFAMKFMFFSFMMGFLGLVLCHEWLMTIIKLRTVNKKASIKVAKTNQNKRARLYIAGSMLGSAILTVVVVSRRSIVGLPNTGGCLLRVKDQFYLFGVPLMILTLIMTVYVVIGLFTLARLYKGVAGYLKSLKGHVQRRFSQPNVAQSATKRPSNLDGLERLIHLLSLYVGLLFASQMIVLPTFIYQFWIEDDVLHTSGRHHSCLSSRCDPSTCPEIRSVSPAVTIVPDVFLTLVGIVLSLWAFQWNTFFKSHFVRLREKLGLRLKSSSEKVTLPPHLLVHNPGAICDEPQPASASTESSSA